MGWLVYQLSGHSATQLAAVNATGGFARLLIGPVIGVALDRWHRRRVVISTTWLSSLQALTLSVLVITGHAHIWQAYVFALTDAVINTTNQNARQAFVYDITDEHTLTNAVTLNAIGQNIARISGPPLAGALIGIWGLAAPFFFLSGTMMIGTALTIPISTRTRQAPRAGGHPIRNLVDGLVYVARDRALLGLCATIGLSALLVYPYLSLLPVFAQEVLHRGSAGYGTLAAAAGIGSVLGLVALAMAGDVRHKGLIFQMGMIVYVVFLIGFSQSKIFWLSAALLAFGGITHAMALAMSQTLSQLLPRNDMRGRVTSVVQTAFGVMPLGALPMGFAVTHWGAARGTGAFFSLALVLLLLLLVVLKPLRRA